MANDQKKIVRVEEKAPESLIVNQIIIRPVDRTQKDIADFRAAHRQAEQIYHAHRVRLYDLYDDVLLDGHLTGVCDKRISTVRNKPLHFTKDGKRVDEMKDIIKSKPFRDIITKVMESKYWGLSGVEFIPGKEFQWREIPRKHIKPSLKIISKEQFSEDGFPYDSNPFLWIMGDDNDLGLLLKCAPYAIWKRGNLADWSQYIEIFGQPVRIVKYDAHDQKTKLELQQVLDESGSSLALMIPKQADFDMKDGKQSNGDGKLQDTFKEAMNNEMSVIILGVTETTTSSQSSGYAQSQTHAKQQQELNKDDIFFVENYLNHPIFLNVLASYGLPVEGGRFEFENEKDLNFLRMRKEIDDWASTKVPISEDYIYETYGIPKPEDFEQRMEEMKAMMALSAAGKALSMKSNGQHPEAAPQDDGQEGQDKPKKSKKGKGKDKNKESQDGQDNGLSDKAGLKLSPWKQIRLALADFFVQASKS
jgi:hypothetical protein